MSATQPARCIALARLTKALGGSGDDECILAEIDHVVLEAASVQRIDTAEDAAASLGIALQAMGVDQDNPEDAKPHERLVQLVREFLLRAQASELLV